MSEDNLVRVLPLQYIHILNYNTNITHVIEGPITYVRQQHEKLVFGPESMIIIPPQYYCIIRNPVMVDQETGELQYDEFGLAKVKFGDQEVRTQKTHPDPFPLYPWEQLQEQVTIIPVIEKNCAYKLRALRDFKDSLGIDRVAGDLWLHCGPCSYIPQISCEIVSQVSPTSIKTNSALKIQAIRQTKDCYNKDRKAGEEWLIREQGAYLPGVYEKIQQEVQGIRLTYKIALQLRAIQNFVDFYGINRKAGEEWLVTQDDSDVHIPDVYEEVVKVIDVTVLNNQQFCYIADPYIEELGTNQFGSRILKTGECAFFLKPYEYLENGIQDIWILEDDEALLLKAKEDYNGHKAGDRWMIYGPCDYIPPIQVDVIEERKRIPLSEKEGIYVRDLQTGEVRAVSGQCYMLKPQEILWEKELSEDVEDLIYGSQSGQKYDKQKLVNTSWGGHSLAQEVKNVRDKTRIVTYKVPHNSAVQLYDFYKQTSRVVFGPDLVMLKPDESFTVMTLSGSTPKVEGVIKTLYIVLGPDFMTDIIAVETSDHANLTLKLSYNWVFEVDKQSQEQGNKIFSVRDFVGDTCKTMASRIRAAVSKHTFESFHQDSASIIRAGVFGRDQDGEIRKQLKFFANNLILTNVDLQNLAPTDNKTRESLQKSVTLAIEILTQTQEAKAELENRKQDQHQKGLMELQKVKDQIEIQKSELKLQELKARTLEEQMKSEAIAKAKAMAKAEQIKSEQLVKNTENELKEQEIFNQSELDYLRKQNQWSFEYSQSLVKLEVDKAKREADIEVSKFRQIVQAIGTQTIVAMARAGPEFQSKLLNGLGLKGFMIMNSKNPINLLSTASGFVPPS